MKFFNKSKQEFHPLSFNDIFGVLVSCDCCRCLLKKEDAVILIEHDKPTLGRIQFCKTYFCHKCKPPYSEVFWISSSVKRFFKNFVACDEKGKTI